ncbi:hypothetical protein CcI49_03060 [Frankia sp. CcI49]|uniref:hypothetical protein n=1 Tax=Frankia sp. CcI49 TaxID=1745382 RepID=UPI000976F919|nr:hypothetical protein [Frankia sp. CcI49]ONH62373.1 hypothetical protein CcI49_03060 [Frankia sp. CcI49]
MTRSSAEFLFDYLIGHPAADYEAALQPTGPVDPGHDRDCVCGGTPACDPYPDPPVSLIKYTPPADGYADEPPF